MNNHILSARNSRNKRITDVYCKEDDFILALASNIDDEPDPYSKAYVFTFPPYSRNQNVFAIRKNSISVVYE